MISSCPATVIAIGVPHPVPGLAGRPPDFLPRPRIERGDEGVPVLILVENDAVLVEQRRSRGAVIRLDGPEIALPENPAVEIKGEQPPRAE